MHRRWRSIAGVAVVCGLLTGTVGVTEGAAVAKGVKHKTFKSSGKIATDSLGPGGSFSAPINTSSKGVVEAETSLDGVATQGPGKTTKTNVKGTATVDAEGRFTMDVDGPWQQSTLTGTVLPPTGFGEPSLVKITIKCVCNYGKESWSWTITISFNSTSTA